MFNEKVAGLATLTIGIFSFTSAADAAFVYLFSSGNATNDALLSTAITNAGHTPTTGVQWANFDGTQSLVGFDAVVFANNYNWDMATTMPEAGQQALLNFVNDGGGMLTTEWFVWNTLGSSRFNTLRALSPVQPTGSFNSAASTTYTVATPNAILNAGLPNSLTFPLTSISGTETVFRPKASATTYYSSSNGGGVANSGGVIGWNYGNGRVLSFSSLLGNSSMEDSNYSLLVSNSIDWIVTETSDPVIPEPTTIISSIVVGFGLIWRKAKV